MQGVQTGALVQPRGLGWGGRWEGKWRGRDTCIPVADFLLMHGRNQHNIVKQYSFN